MMLKCICASFVNVYDAGNVEDMSIRVGNWDSHCILVPLAIENLVQVFVPLWWFVRIPTVFFTLVDTKIFRVAEDRGIAEEIF